MGAVAPKTKKVFVFKKNYVNELKPGVYVPLSVIFKKYIFNALKPSGYVPFCFILKEIYLKRVKTCWLLLVRGRFVLKISVFCPFTVLIGFFYESQGKKRMCSNAMRIPISYTEKECVFCAVRNKSLNVNNVNRTL